MCCTDEDLTGAVSGSNILFHPCSAFTLVSSLAFGIQAPQPLEGMMKSPCAQEGKLRHCKRKATTSM